MQYLIEEAVFERLEIEEARGRADTDPIHVASPVDHMQHARDFAQGRV